MDLSIQPIGGHH